MGYGLSVKRQDAIIALPFLYTPATLAPLYVTPLILPMRLRERFLCVPWLSGGFSIPEKGLTNADIRKMIAPGSTKSWVFMREARKSSLRGDKLEHATSFNPL